MHFLCNCAARWTRWIARQGWSSGTHWGTGTAGNTWIVRGKGRERTRLHGLNGMQGSRGFACIQGQKGEKGGNGQRGFAGIQGQKGGRVQPGINGLTGSQGPGTG